MLVGWAVRAPGCVVQAGQTQALLGVRRAGRPEAPRTDCATPLRGHGEATRGLRRVPQRADGGADGRNRTFIPSRGAVHQSAVADQRRRGARGKAHSEGHSRNAMLTHLGRATARPSARASRKGAPPPSGARARRSLSARGRAGPLGPVRIQGRKRVALLGGCRNHGDGEPGAVGIGQGHALAPQHLFCCAIPVRATDRDGRRFRCAKRRDTVGDSELAVCSRPHWRRKPRFASIEDGPHQHSDGRRAGSGEFANGIRQFHRLRVDDAQAGFRPPARSTMP